MRKIKHIFSIKDLSIYRTELMGWAIIWIMMLHFTFNQIKPLGFIAQFGFAGVEIFLFVSGLGLFFSLEKDKHIRRFYKRRLLRIFPIYYIIGLFASVFLFHDDFFTYLFRYSTIGFWMCGPYWEWFVPSIILLYLIAPFIKKLIDKQLFSVVLLLTIIIIGLSYIIVSNEIVEAKEAHFFLFYRIPAFVFGMICGYWIQTNKSSYYYFIILLMGIPCFVLLFQHHHEVYNYKYFSVFFMLPLFILSFIIISKCMQFFKPILSSIGKASLEIYLIQSIFFHAILNNMIIVPPLWHDSATFILIILSSLLGIITHRIFRKDVIFRFL